MRSGGQAIFRLGLVMLITALLPACAYFQDARRADGRFGDRRDAAMESMPDRAAEKDGVTSQEIETEGDLILRSGNLPMAMVKYCRALEKAPDNVNLRYKIGRLLLVGGASEPALQAFQEVLQRDPGHARAYQGVGRAHFQMNHLDQAEAAFTKALTLDNTLWQSNVFLGIIYDYKKDFTRAIWEYRTAIEAKPDKGMLYNNLGVAYAMSRRYKDAVGAYREAVAKGYTASRVYNNLGAALGKLRAYDRALEAFTKGGGEARAYNNLGCIFLDQGEYERAIRSFNRAIALKPGFYETANDNLNAAKRAWARQASTGPVQTGE